MARLMIKGRRAEIAAAARYATEQDAYARERWECVVLDLFDALSEYMPLQARLERMSDWIAANTGHEKWRTRKKQEIAVYTAALGPGGSFDRMAKVLQRLGIAYRQLSEDALAVVFADYGAAMAEDDAGFFIGLWRNSEITDLTMLLDAWAIANGGHAKERMEIEPCPF